MQNLLHYFSTAEGTTGGTIGLEVETQFIVRDGPLAPASLEGTQGIFRQLCERGWEISGIRGSLISTVTRNGSCVTYELGKHCLEVGAAPGQTRRTTVETCQSVLDQVYAAAERYGLVPWLGAILPTNEPEILAIADKRDAAWLALDGEKALRGLALTSSVQVTVSMDPSQAVVCLNNLADHLPAFLETYPQDAVWRDYIGSSNAGYDPNRYGGPLYFDSLQDYCQRLAEHHVIDIQGQRLVPFHDVDELDIPLFLRSIWWYFRLRRYGNTLCIEIRPQARKADDAIPAQVDFALHALNL